MQNEQRIRNDVPHIRERIVRVIVQYRNGGTSAGTGFFITDEGELLTCFHVILGMDLRDLKTSNIEEYLFGASGNLGAVISIQVELPDGSREMADLVKWNQEVDVARLKIRRKIETPFFSTAVDFSLDYDESAFFCGFQLTGGYTNPTQYPFSTNRAVVSAFPEVQVAGGMYKHIQLNSINLGGNSGAPLFQEGGNVVVGIINGNMNWGGNNFAIVNNVVNNPGAPVNAPAGIPASAPAGPNVEARGDAETDSQTTINLSPGSIRVPLCIAYATPIMLINEKTDILK